MISLLVLSLLTQDCPRLGRCDARGDRTGGRYETVGAASSPGPTAPQFAFADSSGTGMGTQCICGDITGVNGEVITVTRAGAAYCTTGNLATGISVMSLCAANKPRVTTGGSGDVGVLIEGSATNSVTYSQQFDNADWINQFLNVPPITITANFANGPDGTHTADRIQIDSTVGVPVGYARLINLNSCSNAHCSGAVYIKGTSGAGDIEFLLFSSTGSSTKQVCHFVSTSWTRCIKEDQDANTTGYFIFGVLDTSVAQYPAIDVLAWQADAQPVNFITSPVPTTSAPAVRAGDQYTTPYTASGATFTMGATWVAPSAITSNSLLTFQIDASNASTLTVASNKIRSFFRIAGSNSTQDTAGSVTVSASNITAGYYDGTNKAACLAGVCTASAASLTLPTGAGTIWLGTDSAGLNPLNGVLKDVYVSPTGCTGCQP